MAGKMTVIYKTPKDKEAFDKHYYSIHIPLAHKMPGLIKYEINAGPIISPTKHTDTYLVANLFFDSLDAIKTAFATPEGVACAADRRILAPTDADVQIYLFETKEV